MKSLLDYYIKKVKATSVQDLTQGEVNVLMICSEFFIEYLQEEKEQLKREITETN